MPYVCIVVLIAFSAFFSGSEIAYASLNKMRLEKLAESGSLKAKTALFIYENYDKALSTILIGNNLVNIAASSVAAVIAMELAGGNGDERYVGYSTLIITILILICGEIVPKIAAKKNSGRFALAVSLILRFLMFITKPIVVVIMGTVHLISRLWKNKSHNQQSVTEDDLATIIETVEDEGVIDEERGDLLQAALDFSDFTAQEIMTPRVDMLTIDIDDDYEAILAVINESQYSRIPVYEENADNIIGVLYLNHFYKMMTDQPIVDIRSMLFETCYVYKTMPLPDVLAELRKKKLHMAIVTDDYGGTMGLLTMEDILEQLVGEIWDETDEVVDEFKNTGADTYEVSGDMGIYDFWEELDMDDSNFESDSTTVGGWVLEMFNGFPVSGDSFEYKNITVTVKKMDGRRVETVMVNEHPLPEDNDK